MKLRDIMQMSLERSEVGIQLKQRRPTREIRVVGSNGECQKLMIVKKRGPPATSAPSPSYLRYTE
jgi:hypothetical protein